MLVGGVNSECLAHGREGAEERRGKKDYSLGEDVGVDIYYSPSELLPTRGRLYKLNYHNREYSHDGEVGN